MNFYQQMRGVADSLLGPSSQFAQGSISLRRVTPGNGPPHNPGPPTITEYSLSGAVRGAGKENVDGALVQITDKIATVQVPEVEPALSDKIVIDGHEHQIIKIERKPEAGLAVAFIIYARA